VAPELPSIAETLPGFEADQWYGVVAPGGTPAPILARLNAAIREVLGAEEVLQRLADESATPAAGTPAEFGAFIQAEMARWGALVRRAGMRAD
jgi:tripartite-type tricarboxylate transporter receptor subunit TctC